ncbi:amidohydrolase family protein [Metallosphaera javensis (ex Hofmann et al. 2022)]|uniref:amidohydrolase family protein n=1 Tax=Metallosphaera javensis (ex Hofmann et al. 2022) TaxID=99938 RepID=UPI001EDE3507|nr:amidohydrolase [Metallosphaera javensis (ex Hofmann et al. 2022)]
MKILIKAGLAYGKTDVLRNVHLGIEGSRLVAVTREEPEDFEDAELVLGGSDRIVSPGLVSTHTILSLYPFRYSIVSGRKNPNDLVSSMTQNDVYHLAILGAYHLLRVGVTTAVTADPYPESAARAMIKVGIRPIIAVNVGCSWGPSDWKREFMVLHEKWSGGETRVVLKLCDAEELGEVTAVSNELGVPVLIDRSVNLTENTPNRVIALGGGSRGDLSVVKQRGLGLSFLPSVEVCKFTLGSYSPSIALDLSLRYDPRAELGFAVSRLLLTPEEAFRSATLWGYNQLLMGYPLEIGSTSDLVVYQVNEPPFYPLDLTSPYETLVFSTGVPETVIVGGEPVLDGTVPLNVGSKDVEEVQEIINEFGEKSHLEKN